MKSKIIYGLIIIMIMVGLKGMAQAQKTKKATDSVGMPGQGYIHIIELDEDGSQVKVQPNFRVVDPNSVLNVTIDTAMIRQTVGSTLSPDITVKLKKLTAMLAAEKQSIDNVQAAIISYQKGEPKEVWQGLLKKQGPFRQLITRDPDALAIYNSIPKDTSFNSQYEALFKAAAIMISRLKDQIVWQAKTNGIYIQLGAWLETSATSTPIHIPGFDTYTPQPAYSVQRFQIVLTEAQKAQLQQITSLADSANANGLGRAIINATVNSGQILAALENEPAYKTLVSVWSSLNKLVDSTQVNSAVLKTTLQDAHLAVDTYKNDIEVLVKKYKSPFTSTDANQLLVQINTDIGLLQSQTVGLTTKLQADYTTITATTVNETVAIKAQIDIVKPLLQQLGSQLKTDIASTGNQAANFINQLLLGKSLAETSYDFTNQVNQLSIDQLNKTAVIDLNTAGQRNAGDQVTIKLAMGKAGTTATELDIKHYKLYFCKLYATTAVGFLFVSPTPLFQRTGDNAFFRYAPSYSILLKGMFASEKTARTSVSYHSLWAPGLGLNFSALDFNNTGSVQLGVGGVFSIFQDFLQIGYGINTFDGRGYAFFGFKLPVGSFSIH